MSLKSIQADIAKENMTKSEYDLYIKESNQDIIISKDAEQKESTDSVLHNRLYEDIEMDLVALYKAMNEEREKMSRNESLNRAMLAEINQKIKELEEEMEKIRTIMSIKTSETVFIESFHGQSEKEDSPLFYTNKKGEMLPEGFYAENGRYQKGFRLPLLSSKNVLIGPGGTLLGDVKIIRQLGENPVKSDPSYILKESNSTPWLETVYSAQPLEVKMDEDYFNVDRGALCKFEIVFDHISQINEINLTPSGDYPFELISVQAFSSDKEEDGTYLISPDHKDIDKRSRTMESSQSISFEEVEAKKIVVLINQLHTRQVDSLLSLKEERFNALLEGTDLLNNKNAEDIMSWLSEDTQAYQSKYQYNYGFESISIKQNEYHNTGMYVSKPLEVEGALRTIRIETNEIHPSKDTSIEYEVQVAGIWYPIMPVNTPSVNNELLDPELIDGVYSAQLRFKHTSDVVIKRNGIEVTEGVGIKDDQQTVLFGLYDSSATYTASYKPSSESFMLNCKKLFSSEEGYLAPFRKSETLKGGDKNKTIMLEEYAVSDRKRLNELEVDTDLSYTGGSYLPVEVSIFTKEGYKLNQPRTKEETGPRVMNRTDYFSEDIRLPEVDETGEVKAYSINDNKLYLGDALREEDTIHIQYDYLPSSLRIRAKLRNTKRGEINQTPYLTGYRVYTRTI